MGCAETGKHKSHIRFEPCLDAVAKRPVAYRVINVHGGVLLGFVEWYDRWKCWVLSPFEDTVWSMDCLSDVQAFVKGLPKPEEP